MAKVLRFPGPPGSSDLVRILEALVAEARDDKLVFIAFVAEYRHREYVVDIAGETQQGPSVKKMLELLAEKIDSKTRVSPEDV